MVVDVSTLSRLAEYARAGRVVVFDTETTGGSACDEICQIAAVEYVRGVKTRTLALYICPTCEMNPWAEDVHGLSLEFLRENGIAPEEAMRRFFDFVGEDVLLVAHNAKFDLRMLRQECAKFNLEFAPEGIGSAWSSFGVKGNCGSNLGSHVGDADIWWNVTIPFESHEELVGDEFSEKLRGSLVKLAEAFSALLGYRVKVNNK